MPGKDAEKQLLLHNRILEELSSKHREFETLTSLLEEIVFRCDLDGKLSLLNSAWQQKTGWAIGDSIGKPLRDFILNGDSVKELGKQMDDGDLLALEVAIPCQDGREKNFTLKARRSKSAWYGSLHDITDLRTTLKALQNSQAEERKLSLVASGTDNLVIITDAHGRIEWVNRAFIEVTGLTLDAVKGGSPGAFLQGQESDPAIIEKMRSGVEGGQGFNVELINYDCRGKPYWIAIDCTPIFDNDGQLTNFVAIERVITAQKKAEETLRESEQHYRGILDTVTEAIFYCNANLRLQYTNPAWARMTGHTWVAGEETYLSQYVHPEDLPTLFQARDHAASQEVSIKQEFRLKSASGWRRVELQLSSNRPTHAPGKREFTGAIVDVEERWQQTQAILSAKQEAEELSRARTRFIANMSHEIRTPLNAIIGMTSVLQQTPLDAQQRVCIDTLANGGKALLALVNDVLDLSKLDSTDIELEMAEFDLAAVCEEAVDIVAASVEEKNLTLTLSCEEATPQFLLGDAHRLRQLLLNLLANAIKFTASGGVAITLSWEQGDNGKGVLHVAITDSGIGIPAERIDSLFDAFTQADPSTTRQFGGTGLGLAICRQICQAMGGHISAASQPDEGSVFRFSLPLTALDKPEQSPNLCLKGINLDSRCSAVSQSLAHCLGVPCQLETHSTEPDNIYLQMTQDHQILRLAMHETPAILTPKRLWNQLQNLHTSGHQERPCDNSQTAKNLSILIAEDAIPNQLVIDAMLKQLGYDQVDIVANGQLAVERFKAKTYDLVLLDLHMPVMDGIHAAIEIRKHRNGEPHPRIVAASADVTTDARQAAQSAGFDDWLAKPFTRDALERVLDTVTPGS